MAASSTGFPKFGTWWDKLPRPPSLAIHYSGESGGEGSNGKGREKNGKACKILFRIYAKSVENVKIGSYTENGGSDFSEDEGPLASIEEFFDDSVSDFEVSIGEIFVKLAD